MQMLLVWNLTEIDVNEPDKVDVIKMINSRSRLPSTLVPSNNLWDIKEPMALFEKSREWSSRCHGLSDQSCHWSVWVGRDHIWTEAAARGTFIC